MQRTPVQGAARSEARRDLREEDLTLTLGAGLAGLAFLAAGLGLAGPQGALASLLALCLGGNLLTAAGLTALGMSTRRGGLALLGTGLAALVTIAVSTWALSEERVLLALGGGAALIALLLALGICEWRSGARSPRRTRA